MDDFISKGNTTKRGNSTAAPGNQKPNTDWTRTLHPEAAWCIIEPITPEQEDFPMKKVKITVLKTTLDEELAAEYGAEGLSACPMMREGQVFLADYAKPQGFCDEAWTAPETAYSTTAIGFASQVSPSSAATTDCVPSSLSWKLPKRNPRSTTHRCGEDPPCTTGRVP